MFQTFQKFFYVVETQFLKKKTYTIIKVSKTFKYFLIMYMFMYVSYYIVQILDASSGYFYFWIPGGNIRREELF